MWPTDFLRDGECRVLVFTANLCLCLAKPCSELGLCEAWFTAVTVTGEHGAESVGGKCFCKNLKKKSINFNDTYPLD